VVDVSHAEVQPERRIGGSKKPWLDVHLDYLVDSKVDVSIDVWPGKLALLLILAAPGGVETTYDYQ
jgi:hypothetical protein